MVSNFLIKREEQKESFWQKVKNFFKSKKGKIISAVIICLIIFSWTGLTVYNRYFKKEQVSEKKEGGALPRVGETPIELAQSPLDGTMVEKDKANRHPLAIIIENHSDARPHFGIEQASLIYEAIAEGGITRFMAIYGPKDADKVGPVRSARTFFIDWLSEYDGFFAHVGGNLDALEKIKTDGVKDLDQFAVGSRAYWRIPEVGKAIEHTMFTSTSKLYDVAKSKGWDIGSSRFDAYQFKEEATLAERPTTQSVSINFSTAEYNVRWVYEPKENVYLREMAGLPHKDAVTGKQLKAKNIVVMEVERWYAPTTIGESGWAMKTIGEGKAKIFQDGKATEGSWKKQSRTSRTLFYNLSDEKIKFNPGVTWFEIVPPGTLVTVE